MLGYTMRSQMQAPITIIVETCLIKLLQSSIGFQVRSLKRLCRARIQAQLGGSATTARIRCLPLPPQLREFVSLKAL